MPRAGLLRWALAVGGGLLWASCFGRHPWAIVSLVALVPLLLLLDEPSRLRRFLLGWLHGTIFWAASIPWLAHTLSTYGQMPRALSLAVLLLLALYLGIYHGIFLLVGGRIWRQRKGQSHEHPSGRWGGWWIGLALPALWVALESVRERLFGGFPWNQAAYAWTEMPGALPLAAWIGSAGVSFLVLALNVGIVLGWRERRWSWALAGLLIPAVVLAAAGRWAVPEPPVSSSSKAHAVRIIQPNIATTMTLDWQKIEQDYEKIFSLSRDACDVPGALLIWPESAAWPYTFAEDGPLGPRLKRDLEALARLGCPVLFNSVHTDYGETGEAPVYRNSAFLVEAAGEAQRYDKRHLVPWGEYVPLRKALPFVGKLARNAGDFQPADELHLLAWGEEKIGMGICYEMIFPFEVAASVRQGATILATISNDAWYGDSTARPQHLRAARFRAAESRRPLLRAALNGISALVAADGHIVGELEPDVAGIISGRVQGRSDLSPYSRWPWLVPLACWLLVAFVIVPRRRT